MKKNFSTVFLCAAALVLLSSLALAIDLTPLLPQDGSEITQPQVVSVQCKDAGQTVPGGPCACNFKVNNGNALQLPYVQNTFGYYESGPYFVGNGFSYGNNDVHVDCSKGAEAVAADWSFSARYNQGESVSGVSVEVLAPTQGSSVYSPVNFKSKCGVSGTSLNPNANNLCNCRVRYWPFGGNANENVLLLLESIGGDSYESDSDLAAGHYSASFICDYGGVYGWQVIDFTVQPAQPVVSEVRVTPIKPWNGAEYDSPLKFEAYCEVRGSNLPDNPKCKCKAYYTPQGGTEKYKPLYRKSDGVYRSSSKSLSAGNYDVRFECYYSTPSQGKVYGRQSGTFKIRSVSTVDSCTVYPSGALKMAKDFTARFMVKCFKSGAEVDCANSGWTLAWDSTDASKLSKIGQDGVYATFKALVNSGTAKAKATLTKSGSNPVSCESGLVTFTTNDVPQERVFSRCSVYHGEAMVPKGSYWDFRVVCYDQVGKLMTCPSTSFSWSVTNSIGSVSPASGATTRFTAGQNQGTGLVKAGFTYNIAQTAGANELQFYTVRAGWFDCSPSVVTVYALPAPTPTSTPVAGQKACALTPRDVTLAKGASQQFTATCSKFVNNAWTPMACPTMYWTTTVQGTISPQTSPGQAANTLRVNANAAEGTFNVKASFTQPGAVTQPVADTGGEDELSFAAEECTAVVRVSAAGASPTPSVSPSPSPRGPAVSCLIAPRSGVIEQGGRFNFVASCYDVANPLSLGSQLTQHRVACPTRMTWSTTLSGVTLVTKSAANIVDAFASETAVPGVGTLKLVTGGSGNNQAPVPTLPHTTATPTARASPSPASAQAALTANPPRNSGGGAFTTTLTATFTNLPTSVTTASFKCFASDSAHSAAISGSGSTRTAQYSCSYAAVGGPTTNAASVSAGSLSATVSVTQCIACQSQPAGSAGESELSFAETQQYFECSIPLTVTGACVDGWQTEQKTLSSGDEVRVGFYVFKLEDLSSSEAKVYAGNSSGAWNLCGTQQCVARLGGSPLVMPLSAVPENVDAKVWFLQYLPQPASVITSPVANVAAVNELSFDSTYPKAVLKIQSRCESRKASCAVTPSYATGKGPFTQSFRVSFQNIFSDAVIADAKASVWCDSSRDTAIEAPITPSGSGGTASFSCSYPAVTADKTFFVKTEFGAASCGAQVLDSATGTNVTQGVPVITAPAQGGEYWAERVKLKFKVPGTGSYACQYALYSPAGGKLFDVGAVAANTEKTVLMDVQPGGHWVRVRCTTYPLGASAAWKQSTMVRFNVFEPDKPIITSPLDEYRHFGLDKPVAVKFKVAGTSGLYSCNYVFDGAQFVIGTVKAGENSFYIARTVDPMWKDGEKHFYSVRCTPQTIATVAPTPRSVSVTPRASSNPSAIATVIPTNAATWSCSITPSNARLAAGGSQRFTASCARGGAETTCPNGLAWTTTVAGATLNPKAGATTTLSLNSALDVVPRGEVAATFNPTVQLTASGVNYFTCKATVNKVSSVVPSPVANVEAGSFLEFASATSWPILQPGEKESLRQAFYTHEANKPVLLTPVEGGTYNSPVEFAFIVGGDFAQYDCALTVDGKQGLAEGVAAGVVKKEYQALRTGVHKAKVSCRGVTLGTSDVSAWVSSQSALFGMASGAAKEDCNETNQTVNVTQRLGIAVVLSLDVSGSMMGDPLDKSKEAANLLVDNMNPALDKIGLVAFSDDAELKQELSSDFPRVKAAVNALDIVGVTNIGDGILEAISELDARGGTAPVKAIALLTDGAPNMPPNVDPVEYTRQAARAAAAKHYPVYAIGLGDYVNEPLLQEVASLSGGRYYHSPTPADLARLFNELSNTIIHEAERGNCSNWTYESGEVSFRVINANQPVIVSPKESERVVGDVNFSFVIGGNALAYDCTGVLKSTGVTPFQKSVDFGRVVRKSCGLPETFGQIVAGVPLGKYEATVTCAPNYAIACPPVTPNEGGGAAPTATPPIGTATPRPSSIPPVAGLVGYWSFDEASGTTALDGSGYGNNGVITDATRVAGKFGKALEFNGATSFVRVPDSVSLRPSSAVTMEAWVYPKQNQEQYVVQKAIGGLGGSYRIGFRTSVMQIYAEAAEADYNYDYLNKWSHFVGVTDWANGKLSIYLNGRLVKEQSFSRSTIYTSDPLYIGNVYGTHYFFKGLIDEVKVFNRALTAAEVLAEYQGTAPTPTVNPNQNQQQTANSAPSTELFFAGEAMTSDPVNFEVGGGSGTSPTPTASVVASGTPNPSGASPNPSGSASGTPNPSTTVPSPTTGVGNGGSGGGGGYGGGGSGASCTRNSDCGPSGVCLNGFCTSCLCWRDEFCNPCCAPGTDKDCTVKQELAGEELPPKDESEFWSRATPIPYVAPSYDLKLRCSVSEEGGKKRVSATLTSGGLAACDENMRLSVDGKTLAPDASDCGARGVHYFDVSGLSAGDHKATASSLGGASSSCTIAFAAAAGFDWTWILLLLVVILIAAGGYYYYENYYKKGKGGAGGAGGAGESSAAEQGESMDLLES